LVVAVDAWRPESVRLSVVIGDTGEHEEQVAQPIQVYECFRIGRVRLRVEQDAQTTFRSANCGPRDVQPSRKFAPAWQHKRRERSKAFVPYVDYVFEPLRLRWRNPQASAGRFLKRQRHTKIGAKVEQVLLRVKERCANCSVAGLLIITHGDSEPDDSVCSVHFANGIHARISLADARAIP